MLPLFLLKDCRRKIIDRGSASLFIIPSLQTIFHLCIPKKNLAKPLISTKYFQNRNYSSTFTWRFIFPDYNCKVCPLNSLFPILKYIFRIGIEVWLIPFGITQSKSELDRLIFGINFPIYKMLKSFVETFTPCKSHMSGSYPAFFLPIATTSNKNF